MTAGSGSGVGWFSPSIRAAGGTVVVRDRIVIAVVVAGILLALGAWLLQAPWLALLVVVAAIGVAALVYRLEPVRIDLDDPAPLRSVTDEATTGARDTRRAGSDQ